jgi:hypothetical protein
MDGFDKSILAVIFSCVLLMVLCIYLEGRSNAKYLSITRGVELEWYDAVFLDVKVNDINAELNAK